MRTDVKLGLAVGSVLFAVVLVYALFFASGGPKKDQANLNPSSLPDSSTTTADKPAPLADPAPIPAPNAQSSFPASARVEISHSVAPATLPSAVSTETPAMSAAPGSDAAASTGNSGGFNWRDALEHGANSSLIARSETPIPGGGIATVNPMVSLDNPPAPMVADNRDLILMNPTTRPSGELRTYTVKPGESYWSIAKSEYGSASYVSHLIRANPKIPASRLRPGLKIVLPPKDNVVPTTAGPVLAAIGAAPTTRPFDPANQYRVQSGDSLHVICRKVYGRVELAKVEKLYQLNKAAIGPNPSVLKLNMVLMLPEPRPATNTAPASTASGNSIVANPLQ